MSAETTCTVHPGATIVGACERCGDFGCRACMPGKGTRCLSCGPEWPTLESETAVDGHAIFDPAAEPALDGMMGEGKRDVARIQGRCVFFDAGGDGSVRFTLMVDAEPDAFLRARARGAIRGALLRVPSGRLVAGGIEHVPALVARHRSGASGDAPNSEMRLDPGNYAVEAFSVADDKETSAADWAEVDAAIDRRFGPWTRVLLWTLESTVQLGCWIVLPGCAMLVALWRDGLAANPGLALAAGIAFAVAILSAIAYAILHRLPVTRAIRQMRREYFERIPEIVVALRRLPDDADVSKMPSAVFSAE